MPLKHTEDAELARKVIKNRKLHYYVVPTIIEYEKTVQALKNQNELLNKEISQNKRNYSIFF